MNSISNQPQQVLHRLYEDAEQDAARIASGVSSTNRSLEPSDFAMAYLPISWEQGHYLHDLITASKHQHVVEFGTSFGISTIFLADAVSKTGGMVTTTELLESKANTAEQNIKDAGLASYVKIKVGDALQTLKNDSQPIDLLVLDGWKDLYTPLFQLLENQFHSGTVIYADNMDMASTAQYADYVLNKSEQYHSEYIHEGKGLLTRVI